MALYYRRRDEFVSVENFKPATNRDFDDFKSKVDSNLETLRKEQYKMKDQVLVRWTLCGLNIQFVGKNKISRGYVRMC